MVHARDTIVRKDRIDTNLDFAAARKHQMKTDRSAPAGDRNTLAHVERLSAWGQIVMPVAAIYTFDAIRYAYVELAKHTTHGKLVLDSAATSRRR